MKSPTHRFPLLLLCGFLSLHAGCNGLRNDSPGETPGDDTSASRELGLSRQSTGLRSDQGLNIVRLAFDVIRIDLPLKDVQHSRKVWNHVDEMRIDPITSARLARNGIRIGAAAQDAWPAIQAIANLARATVRRNKLTPTPGTPLVIEMDVIRESESIFTYDSHGALSGKTFDAGKKLFFVEYEYHAAVGGSCDILVGFEIRRELGEMTWETRNGVIRQVPAVDRHIFDDLDAALTLDEGDLLLIGLSDSESTQFIVGSRFLTAHRNGERFETLYCLKPVTHKVTQQNP